MEAENDYTELSSSQTEKVIQFQDLTGIEDLDRCKAILSSHDWDLEIAVRFALDASEETVGTLRDSLSGTQTTDEHLINNNNNNLGSTQISLWSLTTRLFTFPFVLVYDTILSILRFAWTLVRPDPRRSIVDPTGDVIKFIIDFEAEYGANHPVFYRGTYSQALNDAKRELKFLLVYLHSDSHQDTRHFCQSVLCSPQIIEFINRNNLLFWACSVNSPEGYRVSQSLRESSYPFLALIVLKLNRMVVIARFEGKQTVEGFVAKLRKSTEDNEGSLIAARLEREERNTNQLLRRQQDEAFAESLRADQEKDRKKQEEKSKKEAEEKAKKEKELEASQRRERLLQLKHDLVDKIPPEPDINDKNATKIVIKLPNGTRLERRFLKTQSIKVLYYFVFCHNQSPLDFQIRTNFPTRDLPGKPPSFEDMDENVSHSEDPPTFEECDLGKGAMLFVNDLEA